ncbi:response regulator receiver protein [Bradyrhizobium guangxiense]
MKDQASGATSSPETALDRGLRYGTGLIRVGFLLMALAYVAFHWADLSEWLSTITHGEAFGIKFDRAVAEHKVDQLKTVSQLGTSFARGAVARAARVGEAVSGARILWLDTNLPNNVTERQALEAMNIAVQRSLSLEDAQRLAKQAVIDGDPYDLIISNVSGAEGPGSLEKCPVIFSQVPDGVEWKGSLADFNASQNRSPRMGFAFAEWLATDEVTRKAYMQPSQPKLIFYTSSNGGIAANVCARVITNYGDILLQNVVSALEEFRWTKLPPLPKAKGDGKISASSKGELEEAVR